jgi:signal peptidase I
MNDLDEFDDEFNKLKDVDRSETDRMISLEKVMARSSKKKFNLLPLIYSSFAVFAVGLFLMMSIKEYTPVVESGKTIIDDQTVPEIPIVEIAPNMFTVEYGIDNMDRGNHDYETLGTGKRIVVDPEVSGFQRGDVIYFTTPEYSNENPGLNLAANHISRVVGLPGERIEIRKGQVYIDEMKLESFYSFPTVRGMSKEEYLETVNPQNSAMTEEDFEESMESVVVLDGTVFVIGDQWWRSIDSRHFGPLSLSKVEGKVIGYGMEQ